MAAELEAEVQAIDKSLLECSAEEIAVVRRRGPRRKGEKRSGRGREGAGAARPAVGPGWRWGRAGRGLWRGEQVLGEGVSLPGLVPRAAPAGSGSPARPPPAVAGSVAVAAAAISRSQQPAFPVVLAGAGGSPRQSRPGAAGPAGGGRGSPPLVGLGGRKRRRWEEGTRLSISLLHAV